MRCSSIQIARVWLLPVISEDNFNLFQEHKNHVLSAIERHASQGTRVTVLVYYPNELFVRRPTTEELIVSKKNICHLKLIDLERAEAKIHHHTPIRCTARSDVLLWNKIYDGWEERGVSIRTAADVLALKWGV